MSALADSSACCGGSEDDSKSSLLPIGVSPRDLQCPICVETIQDAFVTSCGHSFCYACLTTHLQNRNSCPSCGTYVTHDLIYPNFLLNKILSQAAAASGTSASSRLPSSATRLAEIVRRTLDSEPSKVRLEDLDAVIATLQDRRVEVSSQQRVSMLLLLQAFLKHAKLCKEKQVQQLQSHLLLLDQDLKTVVHMQQQQRAQPPHKHLSTHQGHPSLPAVSSPTAPHLPSVGNSLPSKAHSLAGSSQGNVILVQRQATAEATAAAAAAAVAAAGADGRTVHVHRILESGALSTVSIQDIGGLQNSNQALIESMKPDVGSEAVMSAQNGHVVTAQASHLVAPLLQAWDPMQHHMQHHMQPSCLGAHSTEPSPAYIETDHTRDVGSQRGATTASSLMEQPCQVSQLSTSSSSDDDKAGGRIRSKKALLHKSQNGQHRLAGSSYVDKPHHDGGKSGTRMGELIKGDESALKSRVDKSKMPKSGKALKPDLYLSSEEHCFFGGQQNVSLMGMPASEQSMVNNDYSNIINEGNKAGTISMQQNIGSKQQVSALSQVNGINGMESMKHITHASASGALHPSCDLLKQNGVLLQEPLQAAGASTQAEVRWHGGVSSVVGTAATSSSLIIGDENDISASAAHKRQRLCVEQQTAEPSHHGSVARKWLSLTSPQLHLIQSDGNSVELEDSCHAAFSNNKQMTSVSETYSLSNKQMSCIAEVQRPSLQSAAASGGAGAARGSILSSIEFDMEERNFAVAGVSARISIYDYNAVLAAYQHHSSQLGEGSSDQHHMSAHHNQLASSAVPNTTAAGLLAEIHTRSKLTCLSYSAQHKESLIAGDYDGVVTLWDTSTQQSINEFDGHDRRIWSTDFCTNHAGDTSAFASGSDDGTVKVWSIKSDKCTAVLNIKANVCSVRWNPWDEHQVAVGCAAHTLLIYDLRNNKQALATLKGHKKAVSYVRFLSRCEVVSASIDNSLKVWNTQWLHTSCTQDLPQIPGHCSMPNTAHDAVGCNALMVDPKHGVEGPGTACVRTFTGHVNERNFVGLSTCGDMIACGSESNEVHFYHKAVAGSLGSYSFSASTLPPALLPAGIISTQLGHSSSYIQHDSSLSNRLLSLNNGVALKLRTPGHQSHCFITALCWRLSSQTLVAANSHGQLRILGMSKLD